MADQLPSASAVVVTSARSVSVTASPSSRNSSTVQLAHGLPAPAVPETVVPSICVTWAGTKSCQASGTLSPNLSARGASLMTFPCRVMASSEVLLP